MNRGEYEYPLNFRLKADEDVVRMFNELLEVRTCGKTDLFRHAIKELYRREVEQQPCTEQVAA